MKEQILELALDQDYMERIYYNCPFCSGKSRKILAITKYEDCVKSFCHSTNCEAHGVKTWYLSGYNPEQVKRMLLKKESGKDINRSYPLPERIAPNIPQKFIDYLGEYNIGYNLIQKYNMLYVDVHRYNNRVIFEDRLLIPTPSGYVVRSLEDVPKWKNFCNYDLMSIQPPNSNGNRVVIVEDPLSMIRVGEHVQTMCLLGTSLKERQFITNCMKYKEAVVWLDGDGAGLTGALKVMHHLNPYMKTKMIMSDEDPKTYSNYEIKEFLDI